jgi:hypothetical protein
MIHELDPMAVAAFAFLSLFVAFFPRRQALFPIWTLVCLMPMGQELVVLNLHFPLFRILLLLATIRVLLRHEYRDLSWTKVDTIFLFWAFVAIPLGALADPSTALLGNRLGDTYNAALMYFVVRCVVRDRDDIWSNIAGLAFLSLPVAALMLHEHSTGHNLLAAMGGVPELTQVRNGELRCQGAFRHPLLAGAFGATQFPLFLALFLAQPRRRLLATLAMCASVAIVITASSSGALLSFACGLLGLGCWAMRRRMKGIRWTLFWVVLALAVTMNAPVWYLFARLSDVVGGGGWHRAWLIDQAVHHVDEWWLFGTTYTAHWGPAGDVIAEDPKMMDITNHYIMEGVRGGLLRLSLFVAMLTVSFGSIGRYLKSHESEGGRQTFVVWAMGVSLFAHCVTFFSVNYFDQLILVLFWLLGAVASIGDASPRASERPETAPQAQRAYSFEVES